jgi:MFS superfamily sulfate permease-like transporter
MFKNYKNDLPAGLVVFLVAIPLCLGIASASTGRPDLIFSGIIAGIIGGIVVGLLSGSQLGVSGPAAGLITLVAGGIAKLGSYESFLLAVVISGIIQWIAGMLKAGIIGHYFPSSVIKGMLAGIGITLILKQIPHALGYDSDLIGDDDFLQMDGHNTFSEIVYAIRYNRMGAIVISALSLGVLLLMDLPAVKKIKSLQFIPASLFAVMIGILLNEVYKSANVNWVLDGKHLVQLPVLNSANELTSLITLPNFSALTDFRVYELALTLALVASLESLLSVEATDKLDPYKRSTPTNKELKAQGIGNIISGLLGGLPITQVIVRSSANINSGGKTKLAAVFHGVLLLVSVLIFPQVLNKIPIAALACVLLLVGYKLSQISLFLKMYKMGWEQFMPFVVTIIGVVGFDLLKGICMGMAFALFYILRKNYRNSYSLQKAAKPDAKTAYQLKLSEEVTFLNKGSIVQTLHHLTNHSVVTIDGSSSVFIDHDVCEAIYEFKNHTAPLRDIEVCLIGIPEVEKVGGH